MTWVSIQVCHSLMVRAAAKNWEDPLASRIRMGINATLRRVCRFRACPRCCPHELMRCSHRGIGELGILNQERIRMKEETKRHDSVVEKPAATSSTLEDS